MLPCVQCFDAEEGATMQAPVPIKQFADLDLSPDGRTFLTTAEMRDGTKTSFEIPVRNADWLAQHILGFSREALKRQAAAGSLEYVDNAADTLVVEDHRVLTQKGAPFALVHVLGHWESSEDAGGAIALRLERSRGEELAKDIVEAFQTLPQMSRPS
jgi:hypothetical protein